MLKKIVTKRVSLFKKSFPVYETSTKGNLYHRLNPSTVEHQLNFTGFSATKAQLKKIGTVEKYITKTEDALFLIVPETGKFLIKDKTKRYGGAYFKRVTIKDLIRYPILADTFFVGRKFEYLKDYPNLWNFRLCQNFTSLKELKVFMDYEFISDKKFYSIFELNYSSDYILYMYKTKNKPDIVSLFTNNKGNHTKIFQLIYDTMGLARAINVTFEIPAGLNKLQDIHDDFTKIMNTRKLSVCSKEIDYDLKPINEPGKMFFLEYWNNIGVQYRKLETQYDMLEQGIKQTHCLGSKDLRDNTFYSITYMDKSYEIQIHPNSGLITQFLGKYNTQPPEELKSMIFNKEINYRHSIITLQPNKVVRMMEFDIVMDDLPF